MTRSGPAIGSGSDLARSVTAHTSSAYEPLPARLRPPRPRTELVTRVALLERLTRSTAPLVLVAAPAGYGKSVALAQWAARQDRPAAWLQLGAELNDPVAFLVYVAAALEGVIAIPAQVHDLLRRVQTLEDLALPKLAAAVAAAGPFLLVLDDAHLVENTTCWAFAGVLLDHLPPGAVLALGSRSDPPLPLHRLRAASELCEVRAGDLRLDSAEARDVLEKGGTAVADADVERALAGTEGWAAGVYLTALAGVTAPDGAGRRAIAEYLTAEVVDRQPAPVRQFLLRTSVLDQLSPGLCAAVDGRRDAGAILARLVAGNQFVVPVDDGDGWYRYHHLFRELLGGLLERSLPAEVPALHRRAAAWYQEHGDNERAVRHLVEAGDGATTGDLAARACDDLIQLLQLERAARLTDLFSDQQVSVSPALAVTMAYLSMWLPDARLRRWQRVALAMDVGDGPSPVGTASLRSWQMILRGQLARDGVERMVADAELACALEREGHWTWLGSALQLAAMGHYLAGRRGRAAALLDEAYPICGGDDYMAAWNDGLRAMIAADEGRWDEAERLEKQLGGTVSELFGLPMLLARALVLDHRDDPGTEEYLRDGARWLRRWNLNEWRALLGAVVLGEIWLRRGDAEEATVWSDEAQAVLAHYPDAGMLRGRAGRLREALEGRRLADPLSDAERRVLDLLPTQLSAPQIAGRLFVSRNTVKTHMSRIYFKLGVKTRTEAVERARELGLLGSPA